MGKELVIDMISELGFNALIEKGKKLHNEKELKSKIKEFIEQEYSPKIEKLSLDNEIDFGGMCNYINSNFLGEVKGYLLNPEYQTRNKYRETIINKSLYYANSNSKHKSIVIEFIDNILAIITKFESKNIKEQDILLSNMNTNDILTNINGSLQNMEKNIKKEIHDIGVSAPKQGSKEKSNNSFWVNQNTSEKLDPNKIYQHGIFNTQFGSDRVCTEYTLPDGNKTYCEIDPESGAVMNVKYAYPLSEYTLEIPANLIVKKEKSFTTNGLRDYPAEIIHLKWRKRVVLSYENGLLIDIDCNTRTHIDDTNKIIYVLDFSNEVDNI